MDKSTETIKLLQAVVSLLTAIIGLAVILISTSQNKLVRKVCYKVFCFFKKIWGVARNTLFKKISIVDLLSIVLKKISLVNIRLPFLKKLSLANTLLALEKKLRDVTGNVFKKFWVNELYSFFKKTLVRNAVLRIFKKSLGVLINTVVTIFKKLGVVTCHNVLKKLGEVTVTILKKSLPCELYTLFKKTFLRELHALSEKSSQLLATNFLEKPSFVAATSGEYGNLLMTCPRCWYFRISS